MSIDGEVRTATVDGWEMEARWGRPDPPRGQGPSEVVIRATDSLTDADRHRGITSGVMRRLESELVSLMTPSIVRMRDRSDDEIQARMDSEIERALGQIPAGGPRANPDTYYTALLSAYGTLREFYAEPLKEIAERLGKPKSTINSQLNIARDKRRKSGLRTGS